MLYIQTNSPPPGINQGELWALQMLESSGLLPFLQETLKLNKRICVNLLMMKVILKDDDKSDQTGGDALNHLLCTDQPLLPHPPDPALPRGRGQLHLSPHGGRRGRGSKKANHLSQFLQFTWELFSFRLIFFWSKIII